MKRYLIYSFTHNALNKFCDEFYVIDDDPFDYANEHDIDEIADYGQLEKSTNDRNEAISIMKDLSNKNDLTYIIFDMDTRLWFE